MASSKTSKSSRKVSQKTSNSAFARVAYSQGFVRSSKVFQAFIVVAVLVLVGASSYLLGSSRAATVSISYCASKGIQVSSTHNSTSSCVRAVQGYIYWTTAITQNKRVVSVGCNPHGIDGVFGNDTKNAVKCWQRTASLTADGWVGPASYKKMVADCKFIKTHRAGLVDPFYTQGKTLEYCY